MKYTVIIRKEHCENTTYGNCKDCALARAIRQQLPDFKFWSVGGSYVAVNLTDEWKFNNKYPGGWNIDTFEKLLDGSINEHSVTFYSPDHISQLQDAAVKEAEEIIKDKPESHEDRVNREDRQSEILEGARESFILNWREGK